MILFGKRPIFYIDVHNFACETGAHLVPTCVVPALNAEHGFIISEAAGNNVQTSTVLDIACSDFSGYFLHLIHNSKQNLYYQYNGHTYVCTFVLYVYVHRISQV